MKKGPPRLIFLDPDDHSAKYAGKFAGGRQFFLTSPFVPAERAGTATGREFIALYVFDEGGDLLSASVDDLGPRSKIDESVTSRQCSELLQSLGEFTIDRISVAPFKIERFGVEFGFIPHPPEEPDEDWCVTVEPGNYMCFWPPWTSGDYDT